MDIDKIVAEYQKKKKEGKGTQNLEENLLNGVCVEMLKQWLAHGIGTRKTQLKDAQRTETRKNAYIKAMLNRIDWHWREFCGKARISRPEYFKKFLSGYHKKLYDIWTA